MNAAKKDAPPTPEYADIPGTYIFDGRRSRKGYHLNMFCMSLNRPENRAAFKRNEPAYLDRFPMTEAQRKAVLARDYLGMLRLGGNIYYTFKIAALDGLSMQHVGARMASPQMSVEEFRAMMVNGGRAIDGMRSKRDDGDAGDG